jgi:hypothetical protein
MIAARYCTFLMLHTERYEAGDNSGSMRRVLHTQVLDVGFREGQEVLYDNYKHY